MGAGAIVVPWLVGGCVVVLSVGGTIVVLSSGDFYDTSSSPPPPHPTNGIAIVVKIAIIKILFESSDGNIRFSP